MSEFVEEIPDVQDSEVWKACTKCHFQILPHDIIDPWISKAESLVCKEWRGHWYRKTNWIRLLSFAKTDTLKKSKDHMKFYSRAVMDFLLKFTELKTLSMGSKIDVYQYDAFLLLTNLTSLDLDDSTPRARDGIRITDGMLTSFKKISEWDLDRNIQVTNKVLGDCTHHLLSLKLGSCDNITNETLMKLTNLTFLDLDHNKTIIGKTILTLPNLTSLKIGRNKTITDSDIINFTKLIELDITGNEIITDESIEQLTDLKILNISENRTFVGKSFEKLTNLQTLIMNDNKHIKDEQLMTLTNLSELVLFRCNSITKESLSRLTNLETLRLGHKHVLTEITDKLADVQIQKCCTDALTMKNICESFCPNLSICPPHTPKLKTLVVNILPKKD